MERSKYLQWCTVPVESLKTGFLTKYPHGTQYLQKENYLIKRRTAASPCAGGPVYFL